LGIIFQIFFFFFLSLFLVGGGEERFVLFCCFLEEVRSVLWFASLAAFVVGLSGSFLFWFFFSCCCSRYLLLSFESFAAFCVLLLVFVLFFFCSCNKAVFFFYLLLSSSGAEKTKMKEEGGMQYMSPLVKQDLAKLEKDGESRRIAMDSLKHCVENLEPASVPRFLAQVSFVFTTCHCLVQFLFSPFDSSAQHEADS
jgi:hypothetical protein